VTAEVGDGGRSSDGEGSVRATDVGGADDAAGGVPTHPASNMPRTRSGQLLRTRSRCRDRRVHASELPMTNSYLAEGWPVFRTLASLFGADPAPSGRDVKKVGGQRR